MPRGPRPDGRSARASWPRRPRCRRSRGRGRAAEPPSPTGARGRHGRARRGPAHGRARPWRAAWSSGSSGSRLGGLAGELDDVDARVGEQRDAADGDEQARALLGGGVRGQPGQPLLDEGEPTEQVSRGGCGLPGSHCEARPGRHRRVRRRATRPAGSGRPRSGGLPHRVRPPSWPRRRPGCSRESRWGRRVRPGRAGPARRRCPAAGRTPRAAA